MRAPRLLRLFGVVLATACGSATSATAQQGEAWTGQITPYAWAAGVGGNVTPFRGAPTVRFGRSFSEVLGDLDGAVFVSALARRDRVVLFGDLSHASVSRKGKIPPGIPAKGRLRQSSATLAGGYRALQASDLSLDLLAGMRFWRLCGGVEVPQAGVRRSPSLDFNDPIVALRVNARAGPGWSTLIYADAGGFGAGSERTWQIVGTVNHQLADGFYLSAGYRHLTVDYRDGGSRVDAVLAGPLLGATLRF